MARWLAFVLAFACALRVTNSEDIPQIKRQSEPPSCSGRSDVVFLLDSSDAIGQASYQKEVDFVTETINRWDVGPDGIQVGLVSFGSSAKNMFSLNTYSTRQEVASAVQATSPTGGKANLQEALRFATEQFAPENGVRAKTSKVIIMVTNSQSPNRDLTILQGKTTQDNDIQVYTIGVGAGIDEAELSGTASSPASRYFYKADTFDSMIALSNIIGPKICNEVPEEASFLPDPEGCLQKADVIFLLDSSSTIGKDNFRKLEDFLKDVVVNLNVSEDGVHVGLIQYSSFPSLEFPLNLHNSRYDLLKAIDKVSYMGGGANTADALEYMRRQGFSQNSGARPEVPRIAIVITDGSSPNSVQVAEQANNARVDNIGLISVGVGPNMNTAELQAIADDPDANHMFTVTDFDRLASVTNSLIDATCKVDATVPPHSTGILGTLSPDPCKDVVECANYGDDVCTSYVEWSHVNCQRYCGFCLPLYTTPAPECNDNLANCASYGVSSCDGVYRGWALENCRQYCGYCGISTKTLGYYGQCTYKGRAYSTGQRWTDGCDYECTCEDGVTGKFRCYNRCPVYHNLPVQCTLVQDPSSCCLQPRCNFQQTINTIEGATMGSFNGISTCEYKGQQYFQGQTWQDGCDYQCTCSDSNTGHYECHDLCAAYPALPSYCRLEKDAGSCCAKPVCEFDMQQGSFSGFGTVSGNGINSPPPTLPPCKDNVDNCPMYGKGACSQYTAWALQNCRQFCELCDVDREPGPNEVCLYEGQEYHQGETWSVGCNMRCVCERATQGYYRCSNLCPSYTNVPPTCITVKQANSCCELLKCGSGTFISSTTNLYTVGNGGNIFTGQNYVAPTLVTGELASPGTGDSAYHASSISGCLYKGEVYVQGQRWDDGCTLSCECLDAMIGRYRCRARCPSYANLPVGCSMVIDETDTCCSKPRCEGEAASIYIPSPVYGQYQTRASLVQPPSYQQRFSAQSSSGSYIFGQVTAATPAVGNISISGIGYCRYKGQTYQQGDQWEDGCDLNCICDDDSYGHYTCVQRCVEFTNIPKPYCQLVENPNDTCCKIPTCIWDIPANPNAKVTGIGIQQPSTAMVRSTVPPTPAFAFCQYNGRHYDKMQIWYEGCDFKCTCEDPTTNNYRCVSRCPQYENLQASCTYEPDPDDPGCCSIPRCTTPVPLHTLVPNPTPGVRTLPPSFVTGSNIAQGVTGGPVGYCQYDGERYQQGDTWEDGCDYTCVCEDAITGNYKCNQKCPRFEYVPEGCRLVSDFVNPCCKMTRCDPNAAVPTLGTTLKPDPNNPVPTQVPTLLTETFCQYKNVQYRQNEQWMDGCDTSCRCDNSATGVYSCTQRCMSYDSLPAECKLVTDSSDQCCLVPVCQVATAVPNPNPHTTRPVITPSQQPGQSTLTPLPNGQTVIPVPDVQVFPTPTAVHGKITGSASYPEPTIGPNGETPAPRTITYCEYKGSQYQQAEKWLDGCVYTCECVNALQGKYECTERCPRYASLPPECRLVKNPADPCCQVPECGPTPTPPASVPVLTPIPGGSTLTPSAHPGQTTPSPNLPTTYVPTPAERDVCMYKDKSYSQGQQWFDGCDYKCVCENGAQGLYTCNDRCALYESALPTGCSMVSDPNDPFCCKIPECHFPSQLGSTSGFIPTPPLAVIEGGKATPLPTPPQPGQSPSPGTLITPLPGQSTSGPLPTIPNNVCVYNGRTYQQGQRWRDGCSYNCLCEDAQTGHYVCTEICAKNPTSLPPECRLVRDSTNPCCERPYCDFTQTTAMPTLPSTEVPPTGPTLNPLTPAIASTAVPETAVCVYNGVSFRQDATWNDGCDLKCDCEDASTGYYRCNQRCARFDHVPAGCTMVADPRDSCCRVPLCPPVPSVTPQPLTPLPGSSFTPPSPGNTNTPSTMLIPTAIAGIVEGVGVTPPIGTTEKPNPNNPFPTVEPTKAPGCLYKDVMYQPGQQFSDGCQYDCICNDISGRYTCTEKCPVYPSIPPNCQMVNDPSNACCKIPQCLPNPTLEPLMLTPLPEGQTNPNNPTISTPTPQKRDVCVYMGKVYTQGQQWDDGCSKVCVCEDAKTGFYRCSDRCATFDDLPAGCMLVADPNDPLCCQIPQCAPTPNPQFLNPTSGPTEVVSQPVGKVTGLAPVPIPTTAHPGDAIPPQPPGCMYKGAVYRQTQKWQDGCNFNCVCVDEISGAYSCTQRCPPVGPAQPRCYLAPDPNDYCCVQQVCDFSQPTATPGIPPVPNQSTISPPPGQNPLSPGPINVPNPTPPAVCMYQGVPYQQGVSWKEGCSRTCRCEDAVNNYYSCFDRCLTYQLEPGCLLVTDPQDPCCQVPKCTIMVTPSPPATVTPFPNGSYPSPGPIPPKEPGLVPFSIPGIIVGSVPTPTGYCEYKSSRYRTGDTWDDGCDYKCECVDQTTGQYRCTERCPIFPDIPSYCLMIQDPSDQCCQTPYCPGLLSPTPNPTTTLSTEVSGSKPAPTLRSSGPPSTSTPSSAPPLTLSPPLDINLPQPTGTSNPVPKDVCIFMGKAYTQGQQWYDGCDRICICENGETGFYSCIERCAAYPNIAPDCIMVADPKDPDCCKAPQCTPPSNTNVPPTGMIGIVTGNGLPPIPTPSPGGPVPTQRNVCVYKGNQYSTGETWQDGCDLNCQCVDDMTGQYKCTDRCPRYPNLPAYCELFYDPTNPCCKQPLCGENRPTPTPTQAPTTGPNGETVVPQTTTPTPNAFCVYNGVPYRQGQSWDVGCDKVCRCENAMTRQVTCTDRCLSFPVIQGGCILKTDPLDACCQILDCPPQLQPNTSILIPPPRGRVSGANQPRPIGISSMVGGPETCVFNGKTYRQGETWNDGCSFTCVCIDELNGKYVCTQKCPRYDTMPATCSLVQDSKDPCCKMGFCPDLQPQSPPPLLPSSGSPPTGQVLPVTIASPIPKDVCTYGSNVYKEGQQWYDGCEKICICEDAPKNFYRCSERCAKFSNIPASCTTVPDPKDPSCCKVPECPLEPSYAPTGSGFIRPSITPPDGVILGSGKIPVPTPTMHPGEVTAIPLPHTGCYYSNQVYKQGETWDDGCDFTCECTDGMTGVYRCSNKCPPVSNVLPDPVRCKLVQDPDNPCCSVPFCDMTNQVPVFPQPITEPPGATMGYFTPQIGSGTRPPGFCVYQGVYYRQGDTWDIGCSQKCRCEDVSSGFYSCFERCKTFANLPAQCPLKADPADPCCVVPDCNSYPVPGLPTTLGPNGETPPPPTVQPKAVIGGSITGVGGSSPIGINPLSSNTGYGGNACIYKGATYRNGQTWDDGCDFKCECIDAVRGQYRCADRCPAYYFLPSNCHYETNPSDQCCQLASCTGTASPYLPTGTSIPGEITVSPATCTYRDGKQYDTGDIWTDGCALNCKCLDAIDNKYECTARCPVFSSIPSFCHLIPDPDDSCCMKATCEGQLSVIVGTDRVTLSPFLPDNVTNIVPLGTHVVISGTSPLTSSYTGPAISGSRAACVYKNVAYRQGTTWEDGCDYVCFCNNEINGDYTCTTKCPLMPPLPTYCQHINIPGQCCPSVTCNIPDHGIYSPVPELTAENLPTPGPSTQPNGQNINQIIVPVEGPLISSAQQPGGGATLSPRFSVGNLTGQCVTRNNLVYNPGETWIEGCDFNCTCMDGRSGYYSCEPLCSQYENIPSNCTLKSSGCCEIPECTTVDGTVIDIGQEPAAISIFPMAVIIPVGFTGFRPGYLTTSGSSWVGTGRAGCVYKGLQYNQGDKWDDGCDFTCHCEDGVRREFLCQPKCNRILQVPTGYTIIKDPEGCCDLLGFPAMTTTPDPTCKDPLDNCQDYGYDACKGDYAPWAKENCPHYCGFEACGSVKCEDKLSNCEDYEDDACMGPYEAWARQNCAARCNLCPSPATTTPLSADGCFDFLTDCASYGSYACLPPYTDWARKNCNNTCGFCLQLVVAEGGGVSGVRPQDVITGQTSELTARGQYDWVMLLKGVHGVAGDLFSLWASSETLNENDARVRTYTAEYPHNFKSALANSWDQCQFDEVKVSIYNNGGEKAFILFNATNADRMGWFQPSRIINSTYTDIKGSSFSSFDMKGDSAMARQFYVSKDSQDCAGSGWIMVSSGDSCFYERVGNNPTFYYARGTTAGDWSSREEGDVFMISAHGGVCTGLNANNTTPRCHYNGQEYRTGASWQDGCEKNCTCRDETAGYYECDQLCPQYQLPLPENCRLEKIPGECCETLTCPWGETGCYYKGHYYAQGDHWNDGCDYSCTCMQADNGFYTCKTRCVTWHLPSACFLAAPPVGMCCSVPTCPAGYVISYPPGYKQE